MNEIQPLECEDIRINVPWGYVSGRWYGNRQVRPILALHGWQDNSGTWDRLIPLLPRHIGILCIDLPGHGRSSKYPEGVVYHAIDYVHIIIRVKKEYNWKKVSLMGHSMGGIVCFTYTTLYPNTVDMLIEVDIIAPPIRSPEFQLARFANCTEKLLIENERIDLWKKIEPPTYTYEELEQVLHKGSRKSLEKENCKYILNRSINQSKQYPEKYYFSRDGRIKYYHGIGISVGLGLEMAKRIKNNNILVLKATQSQYISDHLIDMIQILRQNNPNFILSKVEGSHYIHLNNPNEVAQEVVPFILRHRPDTLDKWTIDDKNEESVTIKNRRYAKSKM